MKTNTKHKEVSGIYIIVNKVNAKKYVGKSKNIYKRIKWHISALNMKHKDENPHLINSWNKYGRDNFYYEILEEVSGENNISERELFWISQYECLNRDKGYNLRIDIDSKCYVSSETRVKQSLSQKKRHKEMTEEQKAMFKIQCFKAAEKRKGIPNPEARTRFTKYKFFQYNLDDSLVREWSSINEIKTIMPQFKIQCIYNACSGEKQTAYKYKWKKQLIEDIVQTTTQKDN